MSGRLRRADAGSLRLLALLVALSLLVALVAGLSLPDPGPSVDYRDGAWRVDGRPVLCAPSEDSAPEPCP